MAMSRVGRWACVGLLLVAGLAAQEAAPVDLDKLRREITILEQIYQLRLTKVQAQAMLPQMQRLQQAAAELNEARRTFWIETSEAAVKTEYAMLRGQTPDVRQMETIQTARRKYQKTRSNVDKTVEVALSTIERQLVPTQLAMIASPEQIAARDAFVAAQRAGRAQAVQTISQDLGAWARTAPENQFTAEVGRKAAAAIAVAYPGLEGEPALAASQRLQALYQQVREMEPRTYNALRPKLEQSILAALPEIKLPGLENLLMTRLEWADWLADPLVQLLLTKVTPNLAGG